MNGDRVIGGYALRRLLGRGGMGEVHLAATPTGGLAAVKVINPALARDPAFRRRFEREVAAARRVARFCTAPVLDAGIDGDVAYLVTEYVKGPDLAEVVRDQGPLSGGNLEALAVGIATALSAIHGAGVIHRDLKPSNVLISPLGPRVIDFGIAQLVDNDSLASQAILGTPAFMAPEQVRGEPLTPAADVFAWGGVIAFAGTGRLPFGGGAPGEVLYRIMQEEARLDGLDEGILGVVSRALAKDPRLRPTAQGLLSELVGGTRLATATEVVERTWTGTGTAAQPPALNAARPSDAPASGVGPSAGAGAGLAQPGLAQPGLAQPGLAQPGGAPSAGAQPGGVPSIGAPSVGSQLDRAQPGGAASAGAQSGGPQRDGRHSMARPAEGRGRDSALGASGTRPGPAAGGVPTGGRGRRRWPWVAGAAVTVLVAGAALVVPGLWRDTWPYEADFADAWAVGTSEGGSARQAGTGYELTVNPGWRLWKSAPRREPDSGVIVSTKATLAQGTGEYGVWCHGSAGSGDRYEFTVTGSGKVTIVKRRTGTRGTTLYGPADAPVTDVNRIVAECTSSGNSGDQVTLRMWLNERLVAEASDADAPYGPDEAGVHAASGATATARVRFDSFTLRAAAR
ncbi:serine/threonine protein kinase [Nonomuraea polychroma]|uniref:Serine/threonine protein kinase n=1 Tax=Nonomuraea polychroma TaxID=46176 RepID=A0A438MQ16_9ACTN|nr:serine/threonine-protein kinase [Nonomuraea polychroma]RVX47551.1 serine/threonine protein kinase [Nonomuraea polychroma]